MTPRPPDPVPAIRLNGVSFRWPGHPPAVEDVTLQVQQGESLAIIGPNGGGKSTLLRLILGELTPDTGSVEVLGMSPYEARRSRRIGYLPQRSAADRTFPVTVRQTVEMAALVGHPPWRRPSQAIRTRVDLALHRVNLGALADRSGADLSGDQFQRTLLARALAVVPPILVLDEPTSALDPGAQEQLGEVLSRLQSVDGLTLVIVSHDIRAMAAPRSGSEAGRALCDRVACLRRTLHFHDAPEGITPQVLAHVFEHDLSQVFGDVRVLARPTLPEG